MGKEIENNIVMEDILNDQLWVNALTDKESADLILSLYYAHLIDLSCPSRFMKTEVLTDEQLCELLIKLLLKTTLSDIIQLIQSDFVGKEIGKSDISQFSSFDDCYYKAIDVMIRSGIDGISYEQLGFMLRAKPRKKGADLKYGENHGKTAAQLGLCKLDDKHLFKPTLFGQVFNSFPKEEKEALMPKICLYIPIIQNYFGYDMNEDLLVADLEILSETTRKRRMPNIRRLIDIVKAGL